MSFPRFARLAALAVFAAAAWAAAGPAADKPAAAADRVARAKKLLKDGDKYPKGCSDFMSAVLEIPWKSADDLMGATPKSVGKDGQYAGLTPGDVVGWKTSPGTPAHVAIYVGEPGMKFIDVKDLKEKPRAVKNGYGPQELFKSAAH